MGPREGLDFVQLINDAFHRGEWREITFEVGGPDSLAREANIGDRDLVALTVTSRLL
jgi:hypothetical protein